MKPELIAWTSPFCGIIHRFNPHLQTQQGTLTWQRAPHFPHSEGSALSPWLILLRQEVGPDQRTPWVGRDPQ